MMTNDISPIGKLLTPNVIIPPALFSIPKDQEDTTNQYIIISRDTIVLCIGYYNFAPDDNLPSTAILVIHEGQTYWTNKEMFEIING